MSSKRTAISVSALGVVAVAGLLLATCAETAPRATLRSTPSVDMLPAATDNWSRLLQTTPYPYLLPLPAASNSQLDGTYAKLDPTQATPVPCMRCPEYATEGGVWKLHLDRGIYRIYHEITDFRSTGSFAITTDRTTRLDDPHRLLLFNDPVCPEVVGVYTWRLEHGGLRFAAIDDTCAFGLRERNLTSQPWLSCQPPTGEAATTDHWPKPPGCE